MRHELQLGQVHEVGQLHQAHQVHGAVDPVAVLVVEAALVEQAPHDVGGRVGRHFEAHRVAEMARRQLALQRHAQVGDLVLVDEQLAVARDAELVAALHHQLREQFADEALHQRAEQHEAVAEARQRLRHAHQTRQRARRLHDAEQRLAAERVAALQLHHEVQALVQHARERMRGIEPDRREHRQQFVEEIVARPFELRLAPGVGAVEIDALGLERGQDGFVQHRVLLVDEPLRALHHEVVDVLQRHAVRRQRSGVVAHLLLEAGHADLEELVEIAAGDADEAQSFKQRHVRVGRLREDALVEAENAKFTVEQRIASGHRQRGWRFEVGWSGEERKFGNSHGSMTS